MFKNYFGQREIYKYTISYFAISATINFLTFVQSTDAWGFWKIFNDLNLKATIQNQWRSEGNYVSYIFRN